MAHTVDAHWEMQAWCQENRLARQREYHLLQVIKLDPDHKDARNRLGYKDMDGVWVQTAHFFQNQGYVRDTKSRNYRLPQAIEMRSRKEAGNLVTKQWGRDLRNWLSRAKKRDDPEALAKLQSIRDPAAVPGLLELIKKEKNRAIQSMLVDILGQIESANAQNALVTLAMAASDINSVEQCINLLKQPCYNRAGIVASLLPFLSPKKQDPNEKVNKAAWIIGQMEETSAIRPLIGALITTHSVATGASGGNMSVSNDGTGGGGLDMGKKPTHIDRLFTNQSVLDSLKLLTGKVDFGFDQRSWLDWYIRQNSLGTHSLNRDR